MALNEKFYISICSKEKVWIDMLNKNLLNIYYLPELRQFYVEIKEKLNYEFNLTENELIEKILLIVNEMIEKLDYFIEQDKKGNILNVKELTDYFFVNRLTNNISVVRKNIKKTEIKQKNNLYELRLKQYDKNNVDYIDDDFYYEGKVV